MRNSEIIENTGFFACYKMSSPQKAPICHFAEAVEICITLPVFLFSAMILILKLAKPIISLEYLNVIHIDYFLVSQLPIKSLYIFYDVTPRDIRKSNKTSVATGKNKAVVVDKNIVWHLFQKILQIFIRIQSIGFSRFNNRIDDCICCCAFLVSANNQILLAVANGLINQINRLLTRFYVITILNM